MPCKKLSCIIIILLLNIVVVASISEDYLQDSRKVYASNEIMEYIKSGQNVSCTDSIIIGDIKLAGLNLSINDKSLRIVNSSIRIINSEIRGNIEFGNAFFQKPLIFEGSTFSGEHVNFRSSEMASDLIFSGAEFNCKADFTGATIRGSMESVKAVWSEDAIFDNITCEELASFRNDVFQGTLSLKDTQLNGPADFKYCQFNKDILLSNSAFMDGANFVSSRFSELAEFKGSTFCMPASFQRSRFDGIVDFSDTLFANNVTFFYSTFANRAKFVDVEFKTKSDFRKCEFGGFADFSSAAFLGDASFEEAQFSKAARFTNSSFMKNISFYEANFDRNGYFEGARFASRLNLTGSIFNKLALPWDSISKIIEYDEATQLSLISSYKDLDWSHDYKYCYYNYREKKRTSESIGFPRLMDTIYWIYWGYGTNPYIPLAWITILALFFACIYYVLVHYKNAKVVRKSDQDRCEKCPWAKKEDEKQETDSMVSFMEALIFSSRILLMMEMPDDFEIKHAYIGKVIWIERVIIIIVVAPYWNYLLNEMQSYIRPP